MSGSPSLPMGNENAPRAWLALAALAWTFAAPAEAQDYCGNVRAVSAAARDNFASIRGAQVLSSRDYTTYAALARLPGGQMCEVVVAHLVNTTVYTCSMSAEEGQAGRRVRDVSSEIARCYNAAPRLAEAATEAFADAQLDAPDAQFIFSGDGGEVLIFVRPLQR